jgi:hypothetical protein
MKIRCVRSTLATATLLVTLPLVWTASATLTFAQGTGGDAIPGGDGQGLAVGQPKAADKGQGTGQAIPTAPQMRMVGGCPVDPVQFLPCALGKAKTFNPPRTPDGKPDFQGMWANQEMGAPWNVEPQPVGFGVPATPGDVVDPPGRKIPYKPEALAKRNDIVENHPYDDPQAHCAPAGVPRQNYTPFGVQFVQPVGYFVILYEAQHMYRIIPTDNRPHLPATVKLWQGDSVGHWEGNTLVVDYANNNGKHWLDMAGNFDTENLHVVERFTMVDQDTILYQATLTDPTIYTQPWTIALPFGRNPDKNYYLLEFACREGEHDLQHYLDSGASEKFNIDQKK